MTNDIPTELFAASKDMLLVDGFKVQLGAGANLTEILDHTVADGLAFFVTLEGRVNHSTERRSVDVMLTAEFGYKLGDEIMSRLEEFMKLMKAQES